MGRKKKKSEPESPRTEQDTRELPVEDFLDLRLLSSGGKGSNNIKGPPQVRLSQEDAHRLDVWNDDPILLMIRGEDGVITDAAVCSTQIAVDKNTPASPPTPRAIGNRLASGTCQVLPCSLSDRLCGIDVPVQTTPLPSTPVSTATTPQSTPSKGFSFARGGGGDALISPASIQQTTPQTPVRRRSRSLWAIPMHNTAGKRVSSILCHSACFVRLKASIDVPGRAHKVAERLVLAYYEGRYVSEKETLTISFQGKPLHLQVDYMEMDLSVDDLNVGDLALQDDTSDMTPILDQVRREVENNKLALFRISNATKVVIVSADDTEREDASNSAVLTPLQMVAGLDTTISQIKDLLLPPLIHPELYESSKAPKGALLYGPSGDGKSALAAQLASEMKSDHNIHVQMAHCSSLQSSTALVGEAERRLSRLFQQSQPSLIILDDIHLICPKRGGHGNAGGVDRLCATLLSLLDGIGAQEHTQTVILAITSNPSLLDAALRRPGRLDAEVEVPIPDEATRADILKFQLNQLSSSVTVPSLSDADLMSLSRLAKGFNGADCMLALKEAVRCSIMASSCQSNEMHALELSMEHIKKSIRTTKPCTISSVTVEIPQVHWTSIGGMDSVKSKLREAIELPITHAHLFKALHIPPPRGVLLYGPPGCSKTLMARALATEGHMNFLAVKGPELLSKWLGESERALASLFRRARMASPCIIFFDEIDAIATKRDGGEGGSGGERLLSQLLTELDGINGYGGGNQQQPRVVVVGATNRPDLLDNALTRPGRIDRMIYVGLPDMQSRASIFEIGLKGKACSDDIDIQSLASEEVSGGFSGAELIAICREAALFAIEEDDDARMTDAFSSPVSSPHIQMRHLLRAASEMQHQITPEMLDFYANYTKTRATQ